LGPPGLGDQYVNELETLAPGEAAELRTKLAEDAFACGS
jgi:hypothetical protein